MAPGSAQLPGRLTARSDSDMDQLVALCAEFVQDEGLTTLWKDLGHFAPEEFVEDCRQRLGYRVEQGNRARMLRVLLDLAGELGWLRRQFHCQSMC